MVFYSVKSGSGNGMGMRGGQTVMKAGKYECERACVGEFMYDMSASTVAPKAHASLNIRPCPHPHPNPKTDPVPNHGPDTSDLWTLALWTIACGSMFPHKTSDHIIRA